MNDEMMGAVSKIAAAHLVKTVTNGVYPCCWSIVGFSPRVIEEFVEMIADTMPGCELIVDPAYSAANIDSSLLLDPNTSSFTKFRHKFEHPTFLIRKNAMGEEWEGLEQLETLDPQDLLDDPQLYLGYLHASDPYDDTELKGLEALLGSIISIAHPTLDEVLGYVMMVHNFRKEGHLLLAALGEALPELGAFRDESAFNGLKLDQPQPRRLAKLVTEVVRDRRDLTLKLSASGTSLDKETLIGNLQAAVENGDVSQPNELILQRFILAPADDDKARDAAISLDWQKDGVSLLYRRQSKQTQKLGEKTREHLSWSEDVEITNDELQLLDQLDSTKNPSDDLLDSLRDLYEERRVYIKTDRRLNEKWRILLFQQDVSEDDFLLALIKVVRSLSDSTDVEDSLFPLRLRVSLDNMSMDDILDDANSDAIMYFCFRYWGTERLLDPNIEFDLEPILKLYNYALQHEKGDQIPDISAERREKLQDFLTTSRSSRKSNQLDFLAELLDKDGRPTLARAKRFTWSFPSSSFLSGFRADVIRHKDTPLRSYRVTRSLTSSKGTQPPLALDRPDCIEFTAGRQRGELVPSYSDFASIDIMNEVKDNLNALALDGALTADACGTALGLVDSINELLVSAFAGFLAEGLSWRGWEDFAEQYTEYLSQLMSISSGSRFSNSVLTLVGMCGTTEISGEEVTIISPLHPLRFISMFVKAFQTRDAISRWLSDPNSSLIDAGEYIRVLERDLNGPLYPEMVSNRDGSLLVAAAQQGDYSLMVAADTGKSGTFQERASDPKRAVGVLRGIVRDFLILHPFERNNLSVLTHSVSSEQFPHLLIDEFTKAADSDLSGVRSRLFLQDVDEQRLRNAYRKFLCTLEQDEQNPEADVSFLARFGITALGGSTNDESDIDLAFMLDYVAERTRITWLPASENGIDELPSLVQHCPARWSRRRVQDPAQNWSGAYLCCPVNPRAVDTYYQLLYRAANPNNSSDSSTYLPIRQADYTDTEVRSVLESTHRLAHWVVNFDSVVDRRQLQTFGVNVIRYRPSLDGGQNVVISSRVPDVVIEDHLRRKLLELDSNLSPAQVDDWIHRIIAAAMSISGELLLRAAGKGSLVNELLGVVLSQEILRRHLPEPARDTPIWVYLDDFAQWFLHEAKLAGDIDKALDEHRGRQIADLLCIAPYWVGDTPRVRIVVAESKLIGNASAISAASERSRSQVMATLERLQQILGEAPYDDQAMWRLRLGNLVVEAGERSQLQNTCDPEMLRWMLTNGKIELELEGYSHIFVLDETATAARESIGTENGIIAEQWRIPKAMVYDILRVFSGQLEVCPDFGDKIEQLASSQSESVVTDQGEEQHVVALTDISLPTETSVTIDAMSDPDTVAVNAETTSEESAIHGDGFSWVHPAVSSLLANQVEDVHQESQESLSTRLDEIHNALKRFLPRKQIKAEFGPAQITPNAFRIRLTGRSNPDLTSSKLEGLRDQLKAGERLHLINVEVEPGYYAMSFKRDKREVISYLQCLRDRQVTGPESNRKLLLGRREDNGELLYLDLGDDPHALVGGMSGSGKSQLLNQLILDLMLTNDPKHLRTILVDPKQVEFIAYSDSPFLKAPPFLSDLPGLDGSAMIREKEMAVAVMERLISEMDRRYTLMASARVKDIDSYNQKSPTGSAPVPRIVMVFDEFADWMLDSDFKKDVDDRFQRLAGKARAAGIHLILSTQRPDNTVVSPILRANLGAKIALRVDKKANSEIILGEGGAESLLGQGHGIARLAGQTYTFQSAYFTEAMRDDILNKLILIHMGTTGKLELAPGDEQVSSLN